MGNACKIGRIAAIPALDQLNCKAEMQLADATRYSFQETEFILGRNGVTLDAALLIIELAQWCPP